jgi:hypothetical protein
MDIDEQIQGLMNDEALVALMNRIDEKVTWEPRLDTFEPKPEFRKSIAELQWLKSWLVKSLRVALQIEMAVIPPYLVSLWSIRTASIARALIADVVQEEMLHMGLVCNCLSAIGDDPPVASRRIVPKYPTRLPAGILPTLEIGLHSYSEEVIRNVFVEIESPADSRYRWDRGQRYWTIGAFYQLVEFLLRNAPAKLFADRNQLTESDLKLTKVTTPAEAGDAMRLIREQGEGTPGPLFGSDPFADVAHYFRFWEILHHKRIEVHADGTWSFSGDPVPSVGTSDVYKITQVADDNLPQSIAFDEMYTQMLVDFQDAWKNGDQHLLDQAKDHMLELPDLALAIFQATYKPKTGECHGPRFDLR